MKQIASLFLPLLALTACSGEPAPEPAPVATTAAPAPVATPSIKAPDQALFTELYAAACPEAKTVGKAVCLRAGMGSSEVNCEYALGEDEYLRNKATLVAVDGAWTVKDAAATCEAAL